MTHDSCNTLRGTSLVPRQLPHQKWLVICVIHIYIHIYIHINIHIYIYILIHNNYPIKIILRYSPCARSRTAPVDTVDGLPVRLGHLRTARGTTERGRGARRRGLGPGFAPW